MYNFLQNVVTHCLEKSVSTKFFYSLYTNIKSERLIIKTKIVA